MYTKSSLIELRNDLAKKVTNKTATQEEVLLGIAAAHTIDFLNLAGDNHIPLTLSDKTEENVPKVMLLLHKYNLSRRLSASKSREDISKKVSGYELFTLLNGFEASGVSTRIGVISNSLCIEHENPDGKIIRFSVYREMDSTLGSFRMSSGNEPFVFFGSLQPFYQALVKSFLSKIQ